jgi:hypothetical protein
MVVGQQNVGSQREGYSNGETSMVPVTGDESGEGEAMGTAIFGGKEGEEARQLHGVESG